MKQAQNPTLRFTIHIPRWRIFQKDIKDTFKSKIQTRTNITGLPPGPICNPGSVAINAALNPKDTGYYYFCHKAATENSPAEAFYAYTYYEHQQNMRKAGLLD